MKILITGAKGFAGGHLLRYLSKTYGIENVHGTGRDQSKARELTKEGFMIKVGDLVDRDFVKAQLSSYDLIVHCASKSAMWGSYDSFYQANVIATKNIVDVVNPGKQIIHISTANIYFNYKDRFDIRESDPLPNNFNNHYAATKYEAEQIVLKLADNSFATVLRPRAIIGIGDTVVFPRLLRAHNEGRLRIIGKGDNSIDLTSINNLCHSVKLCMNKKEIANREVYNITNGDTIKLWDEIKAVLSGLGLDTKLKSIPYNLAYLFARYHELTTSENDHEPAMTCYGVGVLNYSIDLNIEKAKKELAYEPVESSKQTLKDFVDWFKEYSMRA
jgi:nucleoside-diphosphate-sugar epimerase